MSLWARAWGTGVNSAFDLGLSGGPRHPDRPHRSPRSRDPAGIFTWGVNWEGGLIFEHHGPRALGNVCASVSLLSITFDFHLAPSWWFRRPSTKSLLIHWLRGEISFFALLFDFGSWFLCPAPKGKEMSHWIIFEPCWQTDQRTCGENVSFSVLMRFNLSGREEKTHHKQHQKQEGRRRQVWRKVPMGFHWPAMTLLFFFGLSVQEAQNN